jgi:hypothetical protein
MRQRKRERARRLMKIWWRHERRRCFMRIVAEAIHEMPIRMHVGGRMFEVGADGKHHEVHAPLVYTGTQFPQQG